MINYVFKFMDEYGELYEEKTVQCHIRGRNNIIRDFIHNQPFSKETIGDVLMIVKTTGEELWVYEQPRAGYLGYGLPENN